MNDSIKTYIIYIYRNLITGKYVYVGQTSTSLKKRAKKDGRGYSQQPYFWNEIQRYGGFQNFEAEVLTTTTDKEYANLLEWFYTIEFDTQYPNGCNDSVGWYHSTGYKKRFSGENNPCYGRRVSKETINKQIETKRKNGTLHQSSWNKGLEGCVKNTYWFTDGKINIRRKERPEGFYPGRFQDEEIRRKMREVNTGKKYSKEYKEKLSAIRKGHPGYTKGKHWFTNGIENVVASECPEGFYPGKVQNVTN